MLRRRVVGQDSALKSLVDAMESRNGMNRAVSPLALSFAGTHGTGKTEWQSPCRSTFNDEKAMIRFDMSEFRRTLTHSYTEHLQVRGLRRRWNAGQQNSSAALFSGFIDEIRRHMLQCTIYLQIMDEGKLHDRLGKGDFSMPLFCLLQMLAQWLMEQKEAGNHPTTIQRGRWDIFPP